MYRLLFPLAVALLGVVSAVDMKPQTADIKTSGQVAGAVNVPTPPTWGESYELEYLFSLPYVSSVQSAGLSYPVHVWFDSSARALRTDVFNGMDSTIITPEVTYNIYPRIEVQVCDTYNATVGPTVSVGSEDQGFVSPLPDISAWTYSGATRVRNIDAAMWRLSEKHGEKVYSYIFSVSAKTGWPLSLKMMGVNLFSGSHYDEYLVEFTRFKPGPIAPAAFAPPKVCREAAGAAASSRSAPQRRAAEGSVGAGQRLPPLAQQLLSLLPSSVAGPAPPPSPEALPPLSSAYQRNKALVEGWNAQRAASGAGYGLALNRFAALPHEAFAATMLGLKRRGAAARLARATSGAYKGQYQRVLQDHQLPASVDWRGTGADGPVLDQASCGSCWAFAAAGAMQAAWFLATGEAALYSEQQLVDCSWDYGNNACGGGEMEGAIQYVAEHGGIAMAEDYQYIGQNGYCKANKTTRVGRGLFSGYKNVAPYDEQALMEAVHLHGPLAISFNAGLPPFKFYSEGVYSNPECHTDEDHLDHAVLLVGYGTTPEGVDYWLLKNSWSTYWGLSGYFKITRKGNDCGITSDPVMAVVDDDALAAYKAARQAAAEAAGAEARAAAVDSAAAASTGVLGRKAAL